MGSFLRIIIRDTLKGLARITSPIKMLRGTYRCVLIAWNCIEFWTQGFRDSSYQHEFPSPHVNTYYIISTTHGLGVSNTCGTLIMLEWMQSASGSTVNQVRSGQTTGETPNKGKCAIRTSIVFPPFWMISNFAFARITNSQMLEKKDYLSSIFYIIQKLR